MRKYIYLAISLAYATNIWAGISVPLYAGKDTSCNLKVFHDAAPGEAGTIAIKLFDVERNKCDLTKEKAARALDKALNNYKSRNNLSGIASIFLGRLINYKSLSDYLVKASKANKDWNNKNGRPAKGSNNKYVNYLLYSSNILDPFSAVLSKHNYKILGVSCEKILINEEKLPFDGMCWISVQ